MADPAINIDRRKLFDLVIYPVKFMDENMWNLIIHPCKLKKIKGSKSKYPKNGQKWPVQPINVDIRKMSALVVL